MLLVGDITPITPISPNPPTFAIVPFSQTLGSE